jgi:hypothetical protein
MVGIGGAGEADHPSGISQAGHGEPGGGVAHPTLDGRPRDPVSLVFTRPLDMGGHDERVPPACRMSE